jgi:hypothetical protein
VAEDPGKAKELRGLFVNILKQSGTDERLLKLRLTL